MRRWGEQWQRSRTRELPALERLRERLAAAYAERTGRDIARIDYYTLLDLYKLAVIIEGINARYLAGETRGEGFERFGPQVPLVTEVATELAARAGI